MVEIVTGCARDGGHPSLLASFIQSSRDVTFVVCRAKQYDVRIRVVWRPEFNTMLKN